MESNSIPFYQQHCKHVQASVQEWMLDKMEAFHESIAQLEELNTV